ncbi:OsmC family protein [Stenotrophomonas oahuensis]|uniref:OsmC family protein n=1 Tax=Stenotrophomonas oahuensis TaxID=3003271 RepID=A0ABY9YM48_9GAMM|nr:OsmC family protein [Stenotrophomonas sp. A5586]WNH51368.1 OsmC family protein [Stenotrophomonas sp. A5586]
MSAVRSAAPAKVIGATALSALLLLAAPLAFSAEGTASPLRDYLAAKHVAIQTQQAQPGVPTAIHAKVTAESRSGVRRLRIGETSEFQYISDSGRSYAGYNLGAGSWDSLVGTLASAVADEYVVQAAVQGLPLDGLDVVFTSIPERKSETLAYPNNLSYVAYIDSPATEAQLQALKRAVHENSSAIDLVTQPHQVSHAEVDYVQSPVTRDPKQPPGLRDFITEEKRPAVLARQVKPADGKKKLSEPETLVARAHVEPRTGLRRVFLGKDGYHQQLHDSAPGLLGYGLAPTVEEHLLGVTGTCLTHIFEVQAASRNVLLDSLELTVDGQLSPRFGSNVTSPARFSDIHYKVRIESPASAQDIDALRQSVEATCPLYNLVKDEQKLEGRIVRGAYAEPAQ